MWRIFRHISATSMQIGFKADFDEKKIKLFFCGHIDADVFMPNDEDHLLENRDEYFT
jgi:hypothetical protein